jgi:hypothetical protein
MSGSPEFVRVLCDGGVAVVTLDRPPVNAVSQQMYGEIRDLFAFADERLSGVNRMCSPGRSAARKPSLALTTLR